MMRTCEYPSCNNWAQWRSFYDNEKKERIWLGALCNTHKKEDEKQPHEVKVKYIFAGSEPCR